MKSSSISVSCVAGDVRDVSVSVAQSMSSLPTNRKRGVCGTPVEVMNSTDRSTGRFFGVEGLSPDNFEAYGDLEPRYSTSSSDKASSDSAEKEEAGRARSKSRIFSPKSTDDLVNLALPKPLLARGDEAADTMDEKMSPPPFPTRSLLANHEFNRFMPPLASSPKKEEEVICDMKTTTYEAVKFTLKTMKVSFRKYNKKGSAVQRRAVWCGAVRYSAS